MFNRSFRPAKKISSTLNRYESNNTITMPNSDGEMKNSTSRISRPTLRLLRQGVCNFQRYFALEPTIACFVPTRVNIFGDNLNIDDGFLLSMALPLGTLIVGTPTKDEKARITNFSACLNEPSTCEFNTKDALLPRGSPWSKYIKSVIVNYGNTIPGFNATIVTNCLVCPGFGRMASLHLAMLSFLEILSPPKKKMNRAEKVLFCQKAENEYCGKESHFSNYSTPSLAEEDVIFLIDCWKRKITGVPMYDDVVFLMTFNQTSKTTNNKTFSSEWRINQIKKAAEILQLKSIRQATPHDVKVLESKTYDKNVIECGSFVINELYRIIMGAHALCNNDMKLFGEVLIESNCSLNHSKTVMPPLDELALLSLQSEGVYGCRILETSGCLLTLVQSSNVNKLICRFNNVKKLKLSHIKCNPSNGTLKLKLKGDISVEALTKPSELSKRFIS